jgi:hypothetical protein
MMVVAASGSVGDTTAPSVNAAAQGSPGTSAWAAAATATTVTAPGPIESIEIARASRRRSRGEEKKAAT